MRAVTGHEVSRAVPQLNITVLDEPGSGGASHVYHICKTNPNDADDNAIVLAEIRYQNGPVPVAGVNGVTMEALIQCNIDRLESFQAGPFPSVDNQEALEHLIAARDCLHRRTNDRIDREVKDQATA